MTYEHISTEEDALDKPLLAKWKRWHKENPEFYELFSRFTREAISKGHRNLSAWLIVNRIRWETSIMTTGNEFKISNDFIAFYARHWRETYPMHKDLFNVKRMIGETL